jgi:uncharacterized protein (DUF1330 family)
MNFTGSIPCRQQIPWNPMPAYVIFIREKTRDADQLDRYKEKAQPVFANHPVTFRAYNGRHEVLEGPNAEGVLILEFPSFDAARAWYHDPVYQDASMHRFVGSDYRCILVEGM